MNALLGDAGLDHDLIARTTGEAVLLSSGCMCWTPRGDQEAVLDGQIARRGAGEPDFDRIVTGATGPGPALRMGGVVTVCDAVNSAATPAAGFGNVRRVGMADVPVLPKAGRVAPAETARFRARLTALAPGRAP